MKMEKKKSWSGSNSNLASGTKEACNSDAVGKGMGLKGQVPYLPLQAHREGTGPLPQQNRLDPGAIAHWTHWGLLQGTDRPPSEPHLLYSTLGSNSQGSWEG